MADQKISQLTDGTSFQAGDEAVVNRSGTNYKVDPTQFGSSIDVTGTVTADGDTGEGINIGDVGNSVDRLIRFENSSGAAKAAIGTIQEATFGRKTLAFYTNNVGDDTTDIDLAKPRLAISRDGDISFYEDTGTTAKFFWDASAESLGIGTSSPDGTLHVFAENNYNGTDFVDAPHALLDNGTITNHTAVLVFNSSGVSEANKKSGITGGNYFNELHGLGLFGDISGKDRSATPDVFINDSGNVGIGTSSPNAQLQLTGDIWTGAGTSASPGIKVGDGNTGFYYVGGNVLGVTTNGIERMRIDASGNLLVGTTSASQDIAGFRVFSTGRINASDSTVPIIAARLSTDGEVIRIAKDGTTVGSIGTVSSALYIGSPEGTDSFIKFTGDRVQPSTSTGANRDAAIDLGATGNRFKDLYLSGGVYLGGTGAANLLDDYEEGTWTPEIVGSTTAGTYTYSAQTGNYTKVGRLVTIDVRLTGITESVAGAGYIKITGIPFTKLNPSATTAMPKIANIAMSASANSFAIANVTLSANTDLYLAEYGDNTTFNAVDISSLTSGSSTIEFSLTYAT